jgi:hypothetical protein
MASSSLPQGAFTCVVTLERVRAASLLRDERDGVTYLTARDYELAYRATLRFENGDLLMITAKLFGELNQQVVVRDASGRPVRVSGYTYGRSEISDDAGNLIFEGRYYDSRIVQNLAGDDALTLTGQRIVDHWQNGLGRGAFVGHAFSLGGRLTREGTADLSGDAHGHID